MKKILLIILVIITLILATSCTGNDPAIDPKYWGETYGYEETIDGLRVCLRSDGYYQIVGINEEAVNDGILIIPQYINNIPVMGLGANIYNYGNSGYYKEPIIYQKLYESSSLYELIYKNGNSIQLECKSSRNVCNINIISEFLYRTSLVEKRTKAYINCHHLNYEDDFLIYLPFDMIFLNFDLEEAFGDSRNSFSYITIDDLYGSTGGFSTLEEFLLHKFGIIDPVTYRPEIYARNCVLEQNTFIKQKKIFNELYGQYIHTKTMRYITGHKNTNNIVSYKNNGSVQYYDANSKELYDLIYAQMRHELEEKHFLNEAFKALCANIEFHYNLIINGEEYHDFTHPKSDLYWIDHLDECETLKEPPVPFVEGHTFLGWYTDPECTQLYDFTKPVSQIEDELVWLKLYAKWQ